MILNPVKILRARPEVRIESNASKHLPEISQTPSHYTFVIHNSYHTASQRRRSVEFEYLYGKVQEVIGGGVQ
jgi:hypothetical protein